MALSFGIEDGSGVVRGIYVHSDGVAEHGGYTVVRHYRTREMVESLIALGDLSWVGKCVGEKVDFNAEHAAMVYEVPSQCLAYVRDRGEEWEHNRPTVFRDRDEFATGCWGGVIARYLFAYQPEQWLVFMRSGWVCARVPRERVLPTGAT